MLKLAAKIFDPFGMYSIFVNNIKDLVQELCEAKLPWDEELTGINKTKYETILRQIEQLQCLEMPRFVFDSRKTVSRVELQAFSDASKKGLRFCCLSQNYL